MILKTALLCTVVLLNSAAILYAGVSAPVPVEPAPTATSDSGSNNDAALVLVMFLGIAILALHNNKQAAIAEDDEADDDQK